MTHDDSALGRFSDAADSASSNVIHSYSTSFGMATKLLGRRHRQHVRNIYAMVRIADEIVDGVVAEAGIDAAGQEEELDAYVGETHRAMRTGYSSNIVLHAFARTARACGIDESLTGPFFDSMRADLADADHEDVHVYDGAAHKKYVYGSAEVVGLMCLRVFLQGTTPDQHSEDVLVHGARQLGAAFQNVNFLRDLADDTDRLKRSYLSDNRLTDNDRDEWVRTVRVQLADAAASIPLLPHDARAAVRSALSLFAALTDRVAKTPAAELYERRVRVPDPVKLALTARAVFTTWTERRS